MKLLNSLNIWVSIAVTAVVSVIGMLVSPHWCADETAQVFAGTITSISSVRFWVTSKFQKPRKPQPCNQCDQDHSVTGPYRAPAPTSKVT